MVNIRLVVMLFACLSLSGCASLQLMSWGISGLSYVTTGKSISDHAISTVMKKDCALHRSVLGQQTCIEHDGQGIIRGVKPGDSPIVAVEENWQIESQTEVDTNFVQSQPVTITSRQLPPINDPQAVKANFSRTQVSPNQTVLELMAKKSNSKAHNKSGNEMDSQTKERTKHQIVKVNSQQVVNSSPYVDQPALYAVVGSYNNKHFAQSNIIKQAQHTQVKAKLMVNTAKLTNQGSPKYRVLIGPLNASQFTTNLGDVGETKNHKAWRISLCQQTLLPPPCTSNMFAATNQ